jgi:endonuclease/exonuclease/phosphatase family metal-dependent hydrolase
MYFMPENIKIATWNLLYANWDIKKRLEEASANLFDMDIVCLQEVRSDNVIHTAEVLAKKLGMQVSSTVKYATSKNPLYGSNTDVCSAVLSKHKTIESGNIELSVGKNRFVAFSLLDISGTLVLVFSAHLDWGGEKEYERLEQAKSVNKAATFYQEQIIKRYGKEPIIIFAGDFNTLPDSQTIRYLTGKYSPSQDNQAYWVDAWDTSNLSEENGHTSSTIENPLARRVAGDFVADVEKIPNRRIDYIMIKGWAYGKPGFPISCEVIGKVPLVSDTLASDHFAVAAELWNPKNKDEVLND